MSTAPPPKGCSHCTLPLTPDYTGRVEDTTNSSGGRPGNAVSYIWITLSYRQLHLHIDTYAYERGISVHTICTCLIISDNYATVQSFIRSDAKHRIGKLKAPQKDSTTHFNHDRYQFCIFHGTFLSLHAHLSFQPLVVVFLAGNNQISNAQWQRQHTCWFADDWCVWESTFRLHRAFHGILTEKNREKARLRQNSNPPSCPRYI